MKIKETDIEALVMLCRKQEWFLFNNFLTVILCLNHLTKIAQVGLVMQEVHIDIETVDFWHMQIVDVIEQHKHFINIFQSLCAMP